MGTVVLDRIHLGDGSVSTAWSWSPTHGPSNITSSPSTHAAQAWHPTTGRGAALSTATAASTSKRVLVVAVNNQSSTPVRVHRVMQHHSFSWRLTEVIPWSSYMNAQTVMERIQVAAMHADAILLHRVLLGSQDVGRLRSLKKPLVYDLDDAIYAVPSSSYHSRRWGLPKKMIRTVFRGKPYYSSRFHELKRMLSEVQAVSAGNDELAQFSSGFCKNVQVVPTSIDVDACPQKDCQDTFPVTVGWYGTPDNQWYWKQVAPALAKVANRFGKSVRFSVISSHKLECEHLTPHWIPWDVSRENEDLLEFDIGLMPLTDDAWARGKCGHKALYYMAMGIPAVVSPVGVNARIVEHGRNGYHATTLSEWESTISDLVADSSKRARMGKEARESVRAQYAARTAAQRLSGLLDSVA